MASIVESETKKKKKEKKKQRNGAKRNEIEDISFRGSVSTRVVPSRGRVRGNPIRQADVN